MSSETRARRHARTAALALAALLALGAAAADPEATPESARNAVRAVLEAPSEGFARATAPRAFQFPADHGPHGNFRTEWWYFTGNVADPEERRFAFQLTFFRFALAPKARERASAWGTNQIYMAHFTVTDVAAGRFHAAEAFSREALGLAGARALPFRVWLGAWQASGDGDGDPIAPLELSAADGGYAIDVRLEAHKPLVLNGEAGLSRKSAAAGNASYYYSIPRLSVAGELTTPDGRHAVRGSAWFDREWSTSALAADQAGWDWFALQLSDGRELMVYRLRLRDGSSDAASGGTLVEADGSARSFDAAAFVLDTLEHWQSPRGDARYPSRWRLRVPSAAIDVYITPLIADQELDLAFRYWEGASRVEGTSNALPVAGHGHVELTGYGRAASGVPR